MIFNMEFKSTFGKMIAWIIVLFILTGLLLALFPMMIDINLRSMFDSFTTSLTPSLKNILGFEEKIDYSYIGQYIAFVYQYIAILIVMFAMQIGANSLAKEQGIGNIEYLYSNPISRSEIVTQKLLSNVLTYIIFLGVLAVATFGLSVILVPKDVDFRKQQLLIDIVKIFVGLLCSGFVFMSIGFFISTLCKSSIYTEVISVLFVFATVIFTMAGKVSGGMFKTVVKALSLETFKPINMLMGNINITGIIVNVIIFILFILLTYLVYSKKELKF